MTNQQPPDPRSRRRDLGFDEFIAIAVAFAAIGAILWWGLSRREEGLSWLNSQATPGVAGSPGVLSPSPTGLPDLNAGTGSGAANSGIAEPSVAAPLAPTESIPPSPLPPRVDRQPALIVPLPLPNAAPNPAAPVPPAASSSTSAPSTAAVAPPPDLVVPAATGTAIAFSDVPSDYWAYPFITALAQRGIIKGANSNTFQPDQPITRAEYAALIETVFQDKAQAAIPFKDVPANYWAIDAIDTAVRTGFLKGFPGNEFRPNEQVSRIQVLASLASGLQVAQTAAPDETIKVYKDSDQIPTWAIPVAASATQAGIVVSYPDQQMLNPNQPATRAEVAAMIYQGLVAAGKLEPVQSDYIVRP